MENQLKPMDNIMKNREKSDDAKFKQIVFAYDNPVEKNP